MPNLTASPRNRALGLLADALSGAKSAADTVQLPVVGGLGSLLFGDAPELVNDVAYYGSQSLVRGGNAATGGLGTFAPDRRVLDAAGVAPMAPGAVRAAKTALNPMTYGRAFVEAQAPAVMSNVLPPDQLAKIGMQRGYYRGGESPKTVKSGATPRTGPWYTTIPEEAADYSKRAKNPDVREYAIPANGKLFDLGRPYSHRLAHDLAGVLESDPKHYGKQGQQLAQMFRTFDDTESVPGGALWQALESRYGNDGAAEILSKVGNGAFQGAKGMAGPNEVMVFSTGPVRDANKAKFDLSKLKIDDIYAGVATLGLPGLLASPTQDDNQ